MHDEEDLPARAVLLESLERRWAAADQLPFIMATVLNPWIKLAPFNTDFSATGTFFSPAVIVECLEQLYRRFFGRNAEEGMLYANWSDYITGNPKGIYAFLNQQARHVAIKAKSLVRTFLNVLLCLYRLV